MLPEYLTSNGIQIDEDEFYMTPSTIRDIANALGFDADTSSSLSVTLMSGAEITLYPGTIH